MWWMLVVGYVVGEGAWLPNLFLLNLASALTGRKLLQGHTFYVAETRMVSNRTWLRLQEGGWVFLYHPTKDTLLADPVATAGSAPSTLQQAPQTSIGSTSGAGYIQHEGPFANAPMTSMGNAGEM